MCGIAGGCPDPDAPDEHVRLGDIVFSNDAGIIEYDFVKETEKGSTVRSSPQKPSSRMLSVVGSLQADEILGRRPWEAGIDAIIAASEKFARPDDATDLLYDADGNKIDHPDGTERQGRPRL
jgi:nucleoside phosphorylase